MRRKRKSSKHESWDYYAMLELQDLRWRATAADIKDAFKRVSLRHVHGRGARSRKMSVLWWRYALPRSVP